MSTSITFKLETKLREALEAAAKQDGRSLSDYIRRVIAKQFAKKKRGAAK